EAVAAGDDLLERAERTTADLFLVDAAEPGSGRAFDWSLLDPAPPRVRLVLAGGLTPDNVAGAIQRDGPLWGRCFERGGSRARPQGLPEGAAVRGTGPGGP